VFKTDLGFCLTFARKRVETHFLIVNTCGNIALKCGYTHKLQIEWPWSKGTEENKNNFHHVTAPSKFQPALATHKQVRGNLVHTSPHNQMHLVTSRVL